MNQSLFASGQKRIFKSLSRKRLEKTISLLKSFHWWILLCWKESIVRHLWASKSFQTFSKRAWNSFFFRKVVSDIFINFSTSLDHALVFYGFVEFVYQEVATCGCYEVERRQSQYHWLFANWIDSGVMCEIWPWRFMIAFRPNSLKRIFWKYFNNSKSWSLYRLWKPQSCVFRIQIYVWKVRYPKMIKGGKKSPTALTHDKRVVKVPQRRKGQFHHSCSWDWRWLNCCHCMKSTV